MLNFVLLKLDIMKFFRSQFILVLLSLSFQMFGQDEERKPMHFNGNISITNNGFSFIPTFSLGEPATVFEFFLGGERFSFDPQFRFENNGFKPWSMIFVWRYEIVKQERLQVKLGAHLPAIAFRHKDFNINGVIQDRLVAQRFVTPEFTLNYKATEHLSFSTYSIYGFGLEEQDQTNRTFFFALRVGANQLAITQKLLLGINPQVYYLRMDGVAGFYTGGSISLAVKDFPLSMSSTLNKAISTDLNTKNFDWNLSLNYGFKTKIRREKNY